MDRRASADLPLHSGSTPRWLFDRMVELSGAIAEVIVDEYDQNALLRRIADPYWFQALGCALGFDWHSSGVTTTTMGALKVALDDRNLDVAVVVGNHKHARNPPGIGPTPADVLEVLEAVWRVDVVGHRAG